MVKADDVVAQSEDSAKKAKHDYLEIKKKVNELSQVREKEARPLRKRYQRGEQRQQAFKLNKICPSNWDELYRSPSLRLRTNAIKPVFVHDLHGSYRRRCCFVYVHSIASQL